MLAKKTSFSCTIGLNLWFYRPGIKMKIGISHVKWVFSQATGSFSGIDEDVFASVVHALTGVWFFPHGN